MAMEKFISFQKQLPKAGRWILVTNNLESRDIDNEMTHLWLIQDYKESNGTFVGFGFRQIHDLTHWRYALEMEE